MKLLSLVLFLNTCITPLLFGMNCNLAQPLIEEEGDVCYYCTATIGREEEATLINLFPCKHYTKIHRNCFKEMFISNHFKPQCPCCRQSLIAKHQHILEFKTLLTQANQNTTIAVIWSRWQSIRTSYAIQEENEFKELFLAYACAQSNQWATALLIQIFNTPQPVRTAADTTQTSSCNNPIVPALHLVAVQDGHFDDSDDETCCCCSWLCCCSS